MYKSNLLNMLDNEHIMSSDRKVLIEVAGDILQAESSTCQTMLQLFNPNVIRSKDLVNLVASRYDSEAFINLSQRYATSEDTANKLVQIHRRRASENILEYLSREFFDGNRVRMEFNRETMEMIIRVYVDDINSVLETKINDVFERVKDRLLIGGIKKDLRISLLLVDYLKCPDEIYTYLIPMTDGENSVYIPLPSGNLETINYSLEDLYFDFDRWFRVSRSRLGKDKLLGPRGRFGSIFCSLTMTNEFSEGVGFFSLDDLLEYHNSFSSTFDSEFGDSIIHSGWVYSDTNLYSISDPIIESRSNMSINYTGVTTDNVLYSSYGFSEDISEPDSGLEISYGYKLESINPKISSEVDSVSEDKKADSVTKPEDSLVIYTTLSRGINHFKLRSGMLSRKYSKEVVTNE